MKESSCCNAPVFGDEDPVCLGCGEHCGLICCKCGREIDKGDLCRECDAGIREDIADGKRFDAAAEGGK